MDVALDCYGYVVMMHSVLPSSSLLFVALIINHRSPLYIK